MIVVPDVGGAFGREIGRAVGAYGRDEPQRCSRTTRFISLVSIPVCSGCAAGIIDLPNARHQPRPPLIKRCGNQGPVHSSCSDMWRGEKVMIMIRASASTRHVVVSHCEITFEKKVIIFWIEDSLINVIAGERSDAVARIPQ